MGLYIDHTLTTYSYIIMNKRKINNMHFSTSIKK